MSTPTMPGPHAPQPHGYQQVPHAPYQQLQQRPLQPVPSSNTTLGATNTFAFLAIIFAFVVPLAGIIFGHMGLSQIKRNGDAGRGIALTGLIISYAAFVSLLLFFLFYALVIFAFIGAVGSAGGAFTDLTMS
ncbi:DUF4190 domain-containing protein [Leucobacter sp. HY1908]